MPAPLLSFGVTETWTRRYRESMKQWLRACRSESNAKLDSTSWSRQTKAELNSMGFTEIEYHEYPGECLGSELT